MMAQRTQGLLVAVGVLILLIVLTGWHPFDRVTWFLEVLPALIVLPLLWRTYAQFPLTTLAYSLIFCHAIVLIVGGYYTYARVQLGFSIADLFHLTRNPYDKIGHFMQGFVPAIIIREILIRGEYIKHGKMLNFLTLATVLGISASYELFEWGSAVVLGQGADEFLGTQGDPWDTQSDMLFALIGGSTALLLLSKIHNQQIIRLDSN